MKISVNCEVKFIETEDKCTSLASTLSLLGYRSNTVVVELNNLIINNELWDQENVSDGDNLEIVSIVGGG